jgi:hypothetical protein
MRYHANQINGLKQREKSIQTSAPRSWVAKRRKEDSPKDRQDKEVGVQTRMNSREAVRTMVRRLLGEIKEYDYNEV